MTAPAFFLPAIANNVTTPQFVGAVGAADVSVGLKAGHGALLPSITRGDCSSTGSPTLLNDTGALGTLAVGDALLNLTDGSTAVVTDITGAPNSVRTTPLEGGSLNVWTSGNIWVKGAFIITAVHYDTDGLTVLKRERMRVTNRVTDTLTVTRAYDGDVAQTFSANDYVQILIEKSQLENLQKAIRNIVQKINDIKRGTPWYITTTGSSNAYAATLPEITSMADIIGVPFVLKANFGNTNSATLNINGLGATTIKKLGGGTNLLSGDIPNGMIFEAVYDGTNIQMTTPPGQLSAGAPSGAMVIWTTDTAPTDWLLCYGQAISRTTYAALFAVIGTTFGVGDGSTTFNLPDMRGNVPLGRDNMGGSSRNRVTHANADTLGAEQGAETHTLTTPEIPSHTHGVAHSASNINSNGSGFWHAGSTTNVNSGATGGGGSHNNMQPYMTFSYIIKT